MSNVSFRLARTLNTFFAVDPIYYSAIFPYVPSLRGRSQAVLQGWLPLVHSVRGVSNKALGARGVLPRSGRVYSIEGPVSQVAQAQSGSSWRREPLFLFVTGPSFL